MLELEYALNIMNNNSRKKEREELYQFLLPEGEGHTSDSNDLSSTPPSYLEEHGSVEVVVEQG